MGKAHQENDSLIDNAYEQKIFPTNHKIWALINGLKHDIHHFYLIHSIPKLN